MFSNLKMDKIIKELKQEKKKNTRNIYHYIKEKQKKKENKIKRSKINQK